MFIRIKSIGRDSRFKDTSISAYNVDGQSPNNGKWKTEEEMRKYEVYLDNILKVQEV